MRSFARWSPPSRPDRTMRVIGSAGPACGRSSATRRARCPRSKKGHGDFPESPKIRIALADASRLAGRHDRALELYEALTDAPRELHAEDLAGVWFGRGLSHEALGQVDEALAAYEQATAADPSDLNPSLATLNLLSALGRHTESCAVCERLLDRVPVTSDRIPVQENRGVLMLRLDRLDEAEVAFRRVLELDPERVQSLKLLGEIERRRGRDAEAVSYGERALAHAPQDVESLNAVAWARLRLGDADAAAVGFQRALELAPGKAEFLFGLGDAEQARARYAEAAKAYEQALAKRPDVLQGWNGLGGVALARPGRARLRWTSTDGRASCSPRSLDLPR